VERLHGVLDSRNAAAVFNASAMAAGGGRATANSAAVEESWSTLNRKTSEMGLADGSGLKNGLSGNGIPFGGDLASLTQQALRINTSVGAGQGALGKDEEDSMSATDSVASDVSGSDFSGASGGVGSGMGSRRGSGVGQQREVWKGDLSAVIGLQKRGLRGLMEGRRLRERGGSVGPQQQQQPPLQQARVGLGIASS